MTAAVRRVSLAERRARLAMRHRLAPGHHAADVVDAARSLVGVHGTDAATVYLALRARVPGLTVADVDRALYDDRSVLRHLCMRRTMFVLPRDLVGVAQRACGDGVAAKMRSRLVAEIEEAGIAEDGGRWIDAAHEEVRRALSERGPSTGAQLGDAVPVLRTRLAEDAPGITTRLLVLMSAEGLIERDRPIGTWQSTQHRWALAPEGIDLPDPLDATAALAEAWLRAFGPAPLSDLVWWTGLGLGVLRRGFARVEVVEVELEGSAERGLILADEADPVEDPGPWVALLPSLDPTPMGWKSRGWYLGEHADALFDRSGNIGPTVWVDGRIVGGWAQRRTGEVAVRLLERVPARASRAVEAERAALEAWLGDARVAPRFPTPIDRELRA